MEPSLTIGVEEEYLLVDPETRDLAEPEADFIEECKCELGDRVTPEFLKCQVEIGTPVCRNVKEARPHLVAYRTTLKRIAERRGLRLIAAATHPFAHWGQQHHTAAKRYEDLDRDLQGAIRRMLICGMHVHIGIEDQDLRIDIMNQIVYFLPHLLALSTSSPFWAGHPMGMKSSRLSVFDGLPRSGLPDAFDNWSEYARMIDRLVSAGLIQDASKLWWDLRPSARFPTLEVRIMDVCTRLEDALTIAALYQSIVRMLVRLRQQNQRWRSYPRVLLRENRWLAQRYGCTGALIDLGRGECVPFPALLDELIGRVQEDAAALDCVEEIRHARTIIARGSSACRQIACFDTAKDEGADDHEALVAVVDLLIEETVADLPADAG